MNGKKLKNIKKGMLLGFLGAALMGTGVTVGYLTDQSQTVNNLSFVGDKGMDALLSEPSWKKENGLLMLPGESAPKDPQITNTSLIDLDEWVAVQVEFLYGTSCGADAGKALSKEDMEEVLNVYDIDWNTDEAGWVRFDGENREDQTQRFYYGTCLKRNFPGKGDSTIPLFTKIGIPENVTNREYARIQEMGGIQIKITGMAVQKLGQDTAKDLYEEGVFAFDNEEDAAL